LGEFDNAELKLDSGGSLSLHEEGESQTILLLLHGLNAHSGTWRNNVSHLITGRKVVAPSFHPWPASRRPEISTYTNQILELIAKLAPKKLGVAGNSMGGWIAMKIAGKLGSNVVKAVVLEDSAGTRDPLDEESISSIDSLGIPVLIIWGKNDKIIPVSDAELLHSSIENSELRILPGAGHVPHWEKPDEYNNMVQDFLARNGV
jgi:pimeloyl-ACP methyl ester carboxylesterase